TTPRPPRPLPRNVRQMAARTTVVVTQRERYTPSPRHVDLILDRAGPAARVIVVDGGSPSPIREWHHELAARRDLLLLRVEHALRPSAPAPRSAAAPSRARARAVRGTRRRVAVRDDRVHGVRRQRRRHERRL